MNTDSVSYPSRAIQSHSLKSYILRASLIWGLATLFYFYDNLLQVSPSAMKPELSLAFVGDAEQFGSLSAYCLYAYGLMQIPAGLLMDRFGPRRILTLACIFCSFGSLIFGVAATLWEAKFGRIMIGVGASFALVGCLKIAHYWFPANRFAMMTGLTVAVGFLGAVFGLSTVNKVVEIFGWRESMRLGGWVGILISVFLWSVIRDKASAKLEDNTQSDITAVEEIPQSGKEVLQGLLQVLRHKQTWIAALYAGLMFVPTLAFGGLWGIPFLVEAHGFDRQSAGMCISLIYVGWVFGGPIWGYVSDYLQKRILPMFIATLCTFCICLMVIYMQQLSVQLLGTLLFCLGFFSSGFILAFAVVQESNPPRVAGTAIGFTNALNTLWGAMAQPFIGMILDMNVSSTVGNAGERVFSLVEYQYALTTLPVALFLSFCLLLFLKDTFRESR